MVKRYLVDYHVIGTFTFKYVDAWELCARRSYFHYPQEYNKVGIIYNNSIGCEIILSEHKYDDIDDYRKYDMLVNIKKALEFVSHMNNPGMPILIDLGSFVSYDFMETIEYTVDLVDSERINGTTYIIYNRVDFYAFYTKDFGIIPNSIYNSIYSRSPFENQTLNIYNYIYRYGHTKQDIDKWDIIGDFKGGLDWL